MSLHASSSRVSLPLPISNSGTIKSSQPQLSVSTSWHHSTGPPPLATPTASLPQPTTAKASAEITTNAIWSEPPTSSASAWSDSQTVTPTSAPPSPTRPTATGRLRSVLASSHSDCSDDDDTETETETDGDGGAGLAKRGTLRVRNRERRSSVVLANSPPEENAGGGLMGLWGRKSTGSMKKVKAR